VALAAEAAVGFARGFCHDSIDHLLEAENSHTVGSEMIVGYRILDGAGYVLPVRSRAHHPPGSGSSLSVADVQPIRESHVVRFCPALESGPMLALVNGEGHLVHLDS
jgi:hypothetical protein